MSRPRGSLYHTMLPNGTTRPCSDLEGREWFGKRNAERQIAKDKVGEASVSTVFLSLDHFGFLFETLIFDGQHDGEMWRYKTRAEAEAGHAAVVAALRSGGALPGRAE